MLSADQVFDHHLSVFGEGNIDEILTDYTEETIMIYGDKSWRGLDGAREFFRMWLDDLIPVGSRFEVLTRIAVEDCLYITWQAESSRYRFDFGTNTFLIQNGKVMRQTVATFHHLKA